MNNGNSRKSLKNDTAYGSGSRWVIPGIAIIVAVLGTHIVLALLKYSHALSLSTNDPVELFSDSLIVVGALMLIGFIRKAQAQGSALEESEEKLSALIKSAAGIILVLSPDFRVLEFNTEAERVFGARREEVLNRGFFRLIADAQTRQAFETELRNIFGPCATAEFESVIESGAAAHLVAWRINCARDARGNPWAIIAVGYDITGRKETERELRESEARYRSLFENSPVALFEIDYSGVKLYIDDLVSKGVRDLRELFDSRPDAVAECAALAKITDVNKIALELFEAPSKKVFGTGLGAIFTPDSFTGFKEDLISLSQGGMRSEVKNVARTLAGQERNVVVRTFVAPGYENTWAKTMCSLIDITESKREKDLSDSLNGINSVINSTLDFDQIMKNVVREAGLAIGSEAAGILLDENNFWVVRYGYGLAETLIGTRFDEEGAPKAALGAGEGGPIVSQNTALDPRLNRELIRTYKIRSLLMVTLKVRGEIIGALYFSYHSAAVPFSESQIDFANKLAAALSLSLENAGLYAEERNISHTLQESLLTMPDSLQGVDFGHLYRAASAAMEVGGDFYDIFELEHGRIGCVIGDVSGKGLNAATMTSLVKNTIKAYAYQEESAALIVAKTNEVLSAAFEPASLVTVFFGILDLDTGVFSYCSAGHPPALLRRASGEVEFLDIRSAALGVFPGLEFASGEVSVGPDDIVVLYTDGLIEARCENALYGPDRLATLIKRLDHPDALSVPDAIFTEIDAACCCALRDDIAVLALRRTARKAA